MVSQQLSWSSVQCAAPKDSTTFLPSSTRKRLPTLSHFLIYYTCLEYDNGEHRSKSHEPLIDKFWGVRLKALEKEGDHNWLIQALLQGWHAVVLHYLI